MWIKGLPDKPGTYFLLNESYEEITIAELTTYFNRWYFIGDDHSYSIEYLITNFKIRYYQLVIFPEIIINNQII